jgi:flagellar motility protein MotE (MotC chaperone)
MRILTLTSALLLLAASSAAYAQGRTAPDPQVPKARTGSSYTSEESAAMADAAREKTEALQRARDKRMKTLTRGICTGC